MKKATGRKGKEADVHIIVRALEMPRGSTSTYAAPIAQPY